MGNGNAQQNPDAGSGLTGRTVRVTGESLGEKAVMLTNLVNEIKQLTNQMTEQAALLTGRVWSGEAQAAYIKKFNMLQGEIDKYSATLLHHAENLGTISRKYVETEEQAETAAGSLMTSIF